MPVPSLASLTGLRIWHCHKLQGRLRMQLDPTLLWLWRRPAAVSLIQPLAWELPCAVSVALKSKKKKKKVDLGSNPILATLKLYIV